MTREDDATVYRLLQLLRVHPHQEKHPLTEQTAINEYRAGQLNVLEILEEFILNQMKYGRKIFTCEQIHGVVKSVRLNLEDKFT